MASKGYYFSKAVLGLTLSFGLTAVALAHEGRDCTNEPLSFVQSELRQDEQQLVTDQSSLRRSLIKKATDHKQIALLRQQVRQDWLQIVSDRGYPNRIQEDLSPEFVAGPMVFPRYIPIFNRRLHRFC